MLTDITESFASSMAAANVESTRVEAAAFESALEEVVESPAVGAPLGIEGVSLDDTEVIVPPTPQLLLDAETGVTRVHGGIAEYGTFVIQSDTAGTEPVSLYPRTHVGVVRASDLYEDIESLSAWLDEEFAAGRDSAVLATGASATADMGELVRGVHGPQTVHAIVITDR